jgi:hypothetical protein
MAIPTRVAMNTFATPMCFCVSRQTCNTMCVKRNRSCACKEFPDLRQSINSNDSPELEVPRLEKGWDTMMHSQVTKQVQMGYDTAPAGVVSEDAIY